MRNPSVAALFLFFGVLIIWLAVKGRIRPIIDSLISGKAQA